MIKFFRNIRQNLLMENKTGRYLKYATGEIILVVIGILIALQINNWNEHRKLKTVEIKILKDLKSDIQENIDNLNKGIKKLEIAKKDMSQVLELYKNKTQFHDSLIPTFSSFTNLWNPDFTYAAFENLKNIGVNTISNQALRKEIVNVIEVEMDILDNAEMNRIKQLTSIMILPMQKKYFFRDLNRETDFLDLVPSQYDEMINDPEFYNICTEVAYRQRRSIIRFSKFNTSANKLIAEIDSEIQLLE